VSVILCESREETVVVLLQGLKEAVEKGMMMTMVFVLVIVAVVGFVVPK
jgi:hypothetical protein